MLMSSTNANAFFLCEPYRAWTKRLRRAFTPIEDPWRLRAFRPSTNAIIYQDLERWTYSHRRVAWFSSLYGIVFYIYIYGRYVVTVLTLC